MEKFLKVESRAARNKIIGGRIMKRIICILFVLSLISVCSGFADDEKVSEMAIQPTPVPTLGKWQQFWVDRVELFKKENESLDPEKKNIVFLGDSLTQGFKVDKYFPDLPVLNRGIGSDGVCNFPSAKEPYRGVTHRLKESIFDCNPSHIFFLIGTNDVGSSIIPLEYWLGAQKYVIRSAKNKFPDVRIILLTCPPTGLNYKRHDYLNKKILEWNELIKQSVKDEGCDLIDLYSLLVNEDGLLPDEMTRDGLHFNSLGYDKLVVEVKKILEEDGIK